MPCGSLPTAVSDQAFPGLSVPSAWLPHSLVMTLHQAQLCIWGQQPQDGSTATQSSLQRPLGEWIPAGPGLAFLQRVPALLQLCLRANYQRSESAVHVNLTVSRLRGVYESRIWLPWHSLPSSSCPLGLPLTAPPPNRQGSLGPALSSLGG